MVLKGARRIGMNFRSLLSPLVAVTRQTAPIKRLEIHTNINCLLKSLRSTALPRCLGDEM